MFVWETFWIQEKEASEFTQNIRFVLKLTLIVLHDSHDKGKACYVSGHLVPDVLYFKNIFYHELLTWREKEKKQVESKKNKSEHKLGMKIFKARGIGEKVFFCSNALKVLTWNATEISSWKCLIFNQATIFT